METSLSITCPLRKDFQRSYRETKNTKGQETLMRSLESRSHKYIRTHINDREAEMGKCSRIYTLL